MKRQISNNRADLQFLYQKLVNKLIVEPYEKKHFEKQRIQFIELLEQYYIYTLYHTKINKISLLNKTNIILQTTTDLYTEYKLLEGELYYIDKINVDLINKCNANKLNEYNNIISKIKGNSDIKKDTKIIDIIKTYLNTNELHKINNLIAEQKQQQNEYINYIIMELP